MSDHSEVNEAAGVVGGATFLSRIFGYVRDMAIAGYFGAGPVSDAFIAAFRIPNLFRRLFGEGSLSISFVPVFTEYLVRQRNEAFKMAFAAFRLLSIILVAIVLIGILAAPWITKAVAYGYQVSPPKFDLTVTLTRLMFPYVALIGMVALCMGILNAMGHFAAPALAPVMLNLAMISAIFLATRLTHDPQWRVYGLAIGVVVGGVLQLALQIPFLIRKGVFTRRATPFIHPGLRKVFRLFIPVTFGAAVFQINTLVGNLLASLQPEGSVSYLYFADRLVQFPLGIFGIAVATAVLPILSRQAATDRIAELKETLAYSMSMVWFVLTPAMVGLIVLREPIVALLFQRGAFDLVATRLTAQALLYYSIGLWAFAAVRIVIAAFYARQDTATPVRAAAVSVLANVVLGVILMQPMGHAGLALALSLSSMLNFGFLVFALRSRVGLLGWRRMLPSVIKTVVGSGMMGIIVWAVARVWIPQADMPFGRLLLSLLGSITVGIVAYGAAALILRIPEAKTIVGVLKRS